MTLNGNGHFSEITNPATACQLTLSSLLYSEQHHHHLKTRNGWMESTAVVNRSTDVKTDETETFIKYVYVTQKLKEKALKWDFLQNLVKTLWPRQATHWVHSNMEGKLDEQHKSVQQQPNRICMCKQFSINSSGRYGKELKRQEKETEYLCWISICGYLKRKLHKNIITRQMFLHDDYIFCIHILMYVYFPATLYTILIVFFFFVFFSFAFFFFFCSVGYHSCLAQGKQMVVTH